MTDFDRLEDWIYDQDEIDMDRIWSENDLNTAIINLASKEADKRKYGVRNYWQKGWYKRGNQYKDKLEEINTKFENKRRVALNEIQTATTYEKIKEIENELQSLNEDSLGLNTEINNQFEKIKNNQSRVVEDIANKIDKVSTISELKEARDYYKSQLAIYQDVPSKDALRIEAQWESKRKEILSNRNV